MEREKKKVKSSLVCSREAVDLEGMVWVRCEPICSIWRNMLQASHNKLEAACTLMGKVADCKLRCVVLCYVYILPYFLPTSHIHLPACLSACLPAFSPVFLFYLSLSTFSDYITYLWHILQQQRNVTNPLTTLTLV